MKKETELILPLFVTEDGKEIYRDDRYYYCRIFNSDIPNSAIHTSTGNINSHRPSDTLMYKYFSSYVLAEIYLKSSEKKEIKGQRYLCVIKDDSESWKIDTLENIKEWILKEWYINQEVHLIPVDGDFKTTTLQIELKY